MRLDRTVGEEVAKADAALVEVSGHQQEPVAIERLALRAHERDAVAGGTVQHAMLTTCTTFSFFGSNSRATRPSHPSVPTFSGSQVCQMSIARKCDRGESLKPTPCRTASFLPSQNFFIGAM